MVYFFVRFMAAEDKVLMLFSMESIIDFLTLPPVFLSGKHSIFHLMAEIRCIEAKDARSICIYINLCCNVALTYIVFSNA